jgi:hypothetical protein
MGAEVGGNGSVHWRISHEARGDLATGGAAGAAHRVTFVGGPGNTEARAFDNIAVVDVGKTKGHTGRFRVRLRFERIEDAQAVGRGAQNVMFEGGMYVLVLDVPVIARAAPNDNPPYEVKVDW